MFFTLAQEKSVGIVPSQSKKITFSSMIRRKDKRKLHIKPYKELHARIILRDETDTSIAAKVGLSQQQMSSRMQGRCIFDAYEIARIGQELGLSPEDYYQLFIRPTERLKGVSNE